MISLQLFVKWSQRIPRIYQLGVALWLAGLGMINSVCANELAQWRFNPDTYQLELTTNHVISPDPFVIENPTRIVIDLPNTTFTPQPIEQSYSGLVRVIRIAQFQPNVTRIVLELSPEAKLISSSLKLRQVPIAEGNRWQLTPELKTQQFALNTLLQLPPATPKPRQFPVRVEVPSPPKEKIRTTPIATPELTLASQTQFTVRYRGKKPLTLEVEQPWQEILFLENHLTDHKGKMIAPAKTPVIGYFETSPQGTYFIAEGLITSFNRTNRRRVSSVIPIKARSQLFSAPTSSDSDTITISPNTIFTLTLTEDWHYNNETDH